MSKDSIERWLFSFLFFCLTAKENLMNKSFLCSNWWVNEDMDETTNRSLSLMLLHKAKVMHQQNLNQNPVKINNRTRWINEDLNQIVNPSVVLIKLSPWFLSRRWPQPTTSAVRLIQPMNLMLKSRSTSLLNYYCSTSIDKSLREKWIDQCRKKALRTNWLTYSDDFVGNYFEFNWNEQNDFVSHSFDYCFRFEKHVRRLTGRKSVDDDDENERTNRFVCRFRAEWRKKKNFISKIQNRKAKNFLLFIQIEFDHHCCMYSVD